MLKRNELLLPDSCLNKSGVDEPIFVLRAKDPAAAQTIRLWAAMAKDLHSENKRVDALDTADLFDRWHKENVPQPCEAIAAPPMISRDR